ncbi:tetratricopeptide repeat protein [Clostridium sp.]|uniref:tetratricopeptide repeat protein n=1 Tax=Clostridium sp. TaxID=1506 RepID=UPI003F34AFFE
MNKKDKNIINSQNKEVINEENISFINKFKNTYKNSSYLEPVVVITASLSVVMLLVFAVKGPGSLEKISIATNPAEEKYYENNYSQAIDEYILLQQNDEWPIWIVKQADVYSIKGDYTKSNALLKEAIIKRDKLIRENGEEKYKEKDIVLINDVIFNFYTNGEYLEALTLGEQHLKDENISNQFIKTMFSVYLANNKLEEAKSLLKEYSLNNEDSHDIATLASMNLIVGEWKSGVELLNESYTLNPNELKIYDVIDDVMAYKGTEFTKKIEEFKKSNEKEDFYKIILAQSYVNNESTRNKALDVLNELADDSKDSLGADYIRLQISKAKGENEKVLEILDKMISENKDNKITVYLEALKAFEKGNFEEASELSKKAIVENGECIKRYGELISEIAIKKGDLKSSETYLRTALYTEPFNYSLVKSIAKYYDDVAVNNVLAKNYYTMALKLNSKDSESYYLIGLIDVSEGNNKDAIANIKKAISINDKNYKYHRLLGALYLSEEKYDEGIEETRTAYSLNEKDAITLNNAGYYYMVVEGDIERGMANIEEAYNTMGTSIENERKLSITSNFTKAKEVYEKFMNDEDITVKKSDFKIIN